MRLDVLTLGQCQIVRVWRNQCLETLRTPYPLTEEMQAAFYRDRVCNPNSPHRYWAIVEPDLNELWFIGMGGLAYISWENRMAEISLILDPEKRGKGLGEQAVDLLLEQAFDRMGLKTVCAECYRCNSNGIAFWCRVAKKYRGYETNLPNRKFWSGKWYDSLYFSIDADDWRKVHGKSA